MLKEVRESNQTLQKQLQDEKSCNLKTQLRADDLEKQGESNRREFAQLKDELAETKMLMDNMISKGLYTRLEEELARVREQLKKALLEGALIETKQRELSKLAADRDRVTKELLDCRNDLEAARKAAKGKEEEVRRKEADLQQNREGMKLVLDERNDIKKEFDELETKVTFNTLFPTKSLLKTTAWPWCRS